MAFFYNDIVTESSYIDLDGHCDTVFEGTASEAEVFTSEFTMNAYTLESAMYAADSIMERAIFEGACDADVLVENALTDMIDKVKEGITKLWRKFVKWVTEIRDKLRLFVGANNKFVSKHKTDILKKIDYHKDFKYTGYKFDLSVGKEIEDVMGTDLMDESKINKLVDEYGTSLTTSDLIAYLAKETGKFDSNADSIAEIGSQLAIKFNGGKEDTEEYTTNRSEVEGWMNELKDAKKTNDNLRKAEAKAKEKIFKILKSLDKAKADAKKVKAKSDSAKEEKNEKIATINTKIKVANFSASFISKLATITINNYMRAYKQHNSVCREISGLSSPEKKKDEDKKEDKKTEGQKESAIDFALRYFG